MNIELRNTECRGFSSCFFLTSWWNNNISHDDAGNTTTDKEGFVYFYDYENRRVKIEDSSSVEVATHDYDALGRRIRMVDKFGSTDVTTLFYYNPG